MKAAFIGTDEGKLLIKEVPVPHPGNGEVLVRILAAPVNPSDIARIKRFPDTKEKAVFNPGFEGSGLVVATGKGISRFFTGRMVACSSHYNTSGTWAEYMVTKATLCFPIGNKISPEQGAMALVNPLTAIGFFDIIRNEHHKALINNAAASSLGRMIELIGQTRGIPVINMVRNNDQVQMLTQAGSKHVLDSSDPGFISKLAAKAEELKATILFDSVCSPILGNIIESLPKGSSVVIYGNLSGEENIYVNPRSLIDNNIKISGFYLGDVAKANGMIRNITNLLKVRKMLSSNLTIRIQDRFPLEKINEAIEKYTSNMSLGKVLICP
jgi:NADPH:quinone reductase